MFKDDECKQNNRPMQKPIDIVFFNFEKQVQTCEVQK